MSKELHIALQEAIGDLGTNVLKSPLLVNILQDYGAFDVHDKDSAAIKDKLSDLISDGQLEEILSWKNLSKKQLERKGKKRLKRHGEDKNVRHIIDGVLKALEMPPLSNPPSQNQKSTTPSKNTSPSLPNNPLPTQQSKGNNKLSGRNMGCVLFGATIMIPSGLILFSMGEIGGGLGCFFCALICIIGPMFNHDFWKWNGY